MQRSLLPILVALTLAAACGRIGFDPTRNGTDDVAAPVPDAVEPGDANDLGDAAAACGWQPCVTGFSACCVGSAGMCVAAGTCTGVVYACDNSVEGRCSAIQKCCRPRSGGSICINLDTVCELDMPDAT